MMLHQIGQDEAVHLPDLDLPFHHLRKSFPCPFGEEEHVIGIQYDGVSGIPAAGRTAPAVRTAYRYQILRPVEMTVINIFNSLVSNHALLPEILSAAAAGRSPGTVFSHAVTGCLQPLRARNILIRNPSYIRFADLTKRFYAGTGNLPGNCE